MTKLQMIELSTKLHDEVKAYYNAYSITNDHSILYIAQDLEMDLTRLEIEISYM